MDQYEVGFHSRPNESPVSHAKKTCHPMCHQVSHFFDRHDTVVNQVEHSYQSVLNKRPS